MVGEDDLWRADAATTHGLLGQQCGIALDGWDDLLEGDTMEMFSSERV